MRRFRHAFVEALERLPQRSLPVRPRRLEIQSRSRAKDLLVEEMDKFKMSKKEDQQDKFARQSNSEYVR